MRKQINVVNGDTFLFGLDKIAKKFKASNIQNNGFDRWSCVFGGCVSLVIEKDDMTLLMREGKCLKKDGSDLKVERLDVLLDAFNSVNDFLSDFSATSIMNKYVSY